MTFYVHKLCRCHDPSIMTVSIEHAAPGGRHAGAHQLAQILAEDAFFQHGAVKHGERAHHSLIVSPDSLILRSRDAGGDRIREPLVHLRIGDVVRMHETDF